MRPVDFLESSNFQQCLMVRRFCSFVLFACRLSRLDQKYIKKNRPRPYFMSSRNINCAFQMMNMRYRVEGRVAEHPVTVDFYKVMTRMCLCGARRAHYSLSPCHLF